MFIKMMIFEENPDGRYKPPEKVIKIRKSDDKEALKEGINKLHQELLKCS